MLTRLAASAALVFCFAAATAFAQTPTAHDKTQDARLDALDKQLADAVSRLTTAEKNITAQKTDLEGKLSALADLVQEQSRQIGMLKTDFQALTDNANRELDTVRKRLENISQPDSVNGFVPRMDAAMKSPAFQQEMQRVVHGSLGTKGQFHILNKMTTSQWIYVNRAGYVLRPGEGLTLELDVGTVTTQLPGQEIINWTLAHKGNGVYAESIEIVPARAPVRTIVEPPLYSTSYYLEP